MGLRELWGQSSVPDSRNTAWSYTAVEIAVKLFKNSFQNSLSVPRFILPNTSEFVYDT